MSSDQEIIDVIDDSDDEIEPIWENTSEDDIIIEIDENTSDKAVSKTDKTTNGRPTLNNIIQSETEKYLATLDKENPPAPEVIEKNLIDLVNQKIYIANLDSNGSNDYGFQYRLSNAQIAYILNAIHTIVRITPSTGSDPDTDVIAIYNYDGKDVGTYTSSRTSIRKIARKYHFNLTENEFKDVEITLRDIVPQVQVNDNPNYVPVNNGIFNYETKELMPFDPNIIVMAKSDIDFKPDAISPHITEPDGTIWTLDKWMDDLSDDPEIVQSLWEILGASLRPYVSWNKSAWLYSDEGNNGKGTFCALARNLVGKNSCADIPLNKFGQEFYLEKLVGATAIIVDENDTNSYIDKAANMKAIITGDVITINRKGRPVISYQFHGFMIQCLNEYPRVNDKSQSFYRRQLFIPMTKEFEGREKKYIKDDYLQRRDVLEYAMKKVLLDMDYYELSVSQASLDVLDDYKQSNDPVREFWYEFSDQFTWDLLPFSYLFDLYLAWFIKTNPSGKPLGRNNFVSAIISAVKSDPGWICYGNKKTIRTGTKMDKPEPLNVKYGLKDWLNQRYSGSDVNKMALFTETATVYRGIERSPIGTIPTTTDEGDDTVE